MAQPVDPNLPPYLNPWTVEELNSSKGPEYPGKWTYPGKFGWKPTLTPYDKLGKDARRILDLAQRERLAQVYNRTTYKGMGSIFDRQTRQKYLIPTYNKYTQPITTSGSDYQKTPHRYRANLYKFPQKTSTWPTWVTDFYNWTTEPSPTEQAKRQVRLKQYQELQNRKHHHLTWKEWWQKLLLENEFRYLQKHPNDKSSKAFVRALMGQYPYPLNYAARLFKINPRELHNWPPYE